MELWQNKTKIDGARSERVAESAKQQAKIHQKKEVMADGIIQKQRNSETKQPLHRNVKIHQFLHATKAHGPTVSVGYWQVRNMTLEND